MAIVNLDELSRVTGKSLPTLRRWITQGMPVLKEGTNGAPYEIDPEAVATWLAERDEAERADLEEKGAAVSQLSLFLGGTEQKAGDGRELKTAEKLQLVQLEQAMLKLAREKREVVPVFEVQTVWGDVLVLARTELLGLPDQMAKHGEMSREQRTLLEQSIRRALNHLADGLKGFDVPGNEADPDGERADDRGAAVGPAAAA